jgi:EAL domain-containing protein (putative c-di-GMP-specific phosphodiesterase class I)
MTRHKSAQPLGRCKVDKRADHQARVALEGIETELESVMMTQFGCTELQGYDFARPLDVDALVALLKTFRPTPILAGKMSARSAG